MTALHIRYSEVQLEFVTGISLLVGPAGINLVKPRRLMKFFLFVALEGVDVSYLRIEIVVFQGDGAVLQDLVFGVNFIAALPRFRQRQVGANGKPQQAIVGQTIVESQIKEQFRLNRLGKRTSEFYVTSGVAVVYVIVVPIAHSGAEIVICR